MTTPAPPNPGTPLIPHSLNTHIVKAHLAFYDSSKHRFCSVKDYPGLSSDDAVLVTKSLSAVGVKNESDLAAAKATGYIVTLTSGNNINSTQSEGRDATQAVVSSASYTDWSLTASTTYNLPTDEKFWDAARDAIKAFHRALKGLFVPAEYTRANRRKRGKELKSSKTIHFDNKVWYPVSDLLSLYDTLLTKLKVDGEWQLLPAGVLANTPGTPEGKLTAYFAVDASPLGSVISASTLEKAIISDAKRMREHLRQAPQKPTTGAPSSETQGPKVAPKSARVKSGTTGWTSSFPPFGTAANAYVSGVPACATYMEQIVVMWQSRESGNPLYFGIYAGDPNNGGEGLILGPTLVLDSTSGAAITTTLTPTLITLDDTLHVIVGTSAGGNVQMLLHYCFNRDLTNPLWTMADRAVVGPTALSPVLGLLDDSTIMCMWVNSSNALQWASWQQPPNWSPVDPTDPNQAPPGKWTQGMSSVTLNGQIVTTTHPPALLMLNGKLAMSYVDSNSQVQLLAFSDLNSQSWSSVAPGLNPDPSAQGLVGAGYDDEYAIIASRSPGQQNIAVSIWRGGSWDAPTGMNNEASQDSVCAVILNRCAYVFFESTDGGPQYQLYCCYMDLTTIPYHPSSWMKDLTTDRRLNIMAIPGTHDTGTYNAPWLYKQFGIATQGMDLQSQLYAGIRSFDFRLSLDSSGNVIFVHGGWDVDLDFDDACDILYTFLSNQPNEALIVCMMNDSDASDADVFYAVDYDLYMDEDYPYEYWYGYLGDGNGLNDFPLLSEARGGIVLLRRYASDLGPPFGVDFSGYSGVQDPSYVGGKFTVSGALQGGDLDVQAQDLYQIGLGYGSIVWPGGTPIPDYNTKWGYVQNVLDVSALDTSSTSSNLFVNYTSAACTVLGTGIPPPAGWDPSELAEGMWTFSLITGYTDYEGINSKVQRYLDQSSQTTAHGLICMDFPEDPDETISSIVEANNFN